MSRPPIVDLLLERRAQHPLAEFLVMGDRHVSWSEFVDGSFRAANGLRELGVAPGDRVALMMANSVEFLFTYFGVLASGAAPVPVNVAQRGDALGHIFNDSSSVAAVVDRDVETAVRKVGPSGIALVVRGRESFDRLMSASGDEPAMPTGARSGLGILYTSGTTGPPKGVVAEGYDLSHVHQLLGLLGVQSGETVYTSLPLFHGNALILSAMAAVWNDWRLALAERFSASRFWDDVARYEAVSFNALGAMIPILLKQPQRSHDRDNPARVCLSAACPAWAWQEFERRFGLRIIEFYGLVDYPGYLINDEGVPGAMGRPKGETEFRVVDSGDEPVPHGVVGELVMRHPRGRLTHYHNDAEATETAYRGGWFHTGDLAVMDERGIFTYAGRKKESIRRRGENISAWEIENVVNRHPAVAESAAHAVASELGEDEVKLVVVLRPGASMTPDELIAHCEGNMADYAIPAYLDFREALPKTGTHRVQYAVLKDEGITPTTWCRPVPARGR